MAFLRRLLSYLRPLKKAKRGGYGDEVLFAGWVEPARPRKTRARQRK